MKKYLTLEVLIDETVDDAKECAKEIISDAMCHYYCCDGTVKITITDNSED